MTICWAQRVLLALGVCCGIIDSVTDGCVLFPVWCLGQDVEFGSRSLSFHRLNNVKRCLYTTCSPNYCCMICCICKYRCVPNDKIYSYCSCNLVLHFCTLFMPISLNNEFMYNIWAGPYENVSYVICEQQRRSSACASAQSDQRLCCSL